MVEAVLVQELLLLRILLVRPSAVVVRAEHHLKLLGQAHVVPLLEGQRERDLHLELLVEDLALEVGHVVVLAVGAVERLLALLECLVAFGVALLLELQEARENVFDVLENLEVELNQVTVQVDLLDSREYRFCELLLLLVVGVV